MTDLIALDDSMRAKDADGHLRVAMSHISKATVNPYLGREIPGWQALGLKADKVYQLLRDPKELARAAPTFAGKPILIKHTPVSAKDPQKDLTVGAIGSDVVFNAPYLDADLMIWDAPAIALIESGKQEQLSCGYRYRPDMTAGVYEGVPYDGVMRDIQGNHVALVEVGRAGADVIVHDHDPFHHEDKPMKQRKLGLIAAKVELRRSLASVVSEAKRNAILAQMMALDAAIDDSDEDDDEPLTPSEKQAAEEDAELQAEEEEAIEAEAKAARSKAARSKQTRAAKSRKSKSGLKANAVATDDDEDEDSDPAMDAVLIDVQTIAKDEVSKAIMANDALHAARRAVEPVVGVVGLGSAEAVYRFALDQMGMDTHGVHASALPTIFNLANTSSSRFAHDAAWTGAEQAFSADVGLDRFK